MDRRGGRIVAIANFNLRSDRLSRLIKRDPVHAFREKLDRLKLFDVADDDLVPGPLDLNDV